MNWNVAGLKSKIIGGDNPKNIAALREYKHLRIPAFSASFADAYTVVEKMRGMGYLVEMKEMPDGLPFLANRDDEPEHALYKKSYCALSYLRGRASTEAQETRRYIRENLHGLSDAMPHAICLAALAPRDALEKYEERAA